MTEQTELSEESAQHIRRTARIALYAVALIVAVWFIIMASRSFVTALPKIGNAVASPFMALVSLQKVADQTATSTANTAPTVNTTTAAAPAAAASTSTQETTATTAATTPASAQAVPVVNTTPAYLAATIVLVDGQHAEFRIVNTGGLTSREGWTFTAHLPFANQIYTSPVQPALVSGHGYTYTLNWGQQYAVQSMTGAFSVTVNQ